MTFYFQLFALLIINCLVIIGFNKATFFEWVDEDHKQLGVIEGSKMILWQVRFYSEIVFGKFWSKPICTCPVCMSSLHSIYVYWFFMPWTLHSLLFYPIYILALAGFNHTYSTVILKD